MNMSKSHWSRKVLLFAILLVLSAVSSSPVYGQEGGDEQHRQVPGLDVIILVDESETMWNQTDTKGVRVNTVNFFADMLASEQSGPAHRLGIIAFGSKPYVIPYVLLDSREAAEDLKEQYAAVHRSIEPYGSRQYTDINEALRAALTLIEQDRDPDRKTAIILISDGQPTNAKVSEEKGQAVVLAYLEETRGLLEQLRDYPYIDNVCPSAEGAPLYMVSIGVDKLAESSTPDFIATYKEFWQGVSSRSGGYYKETEEVEEMQAVSAYIFSELLCTSAAPSLTVRPSQVLEYQVYDNYFQIMFTISAKENPDLESQVYRPQDDGTAGGVLLSRDEEGVAWQSNGIDYEVWSVGYTEPWSGTWRVSMEGEGRAEFSYVFFPNMTIELDEPSGSFLPVDEPFTIRARIVDEDGNMVNIPLRDFQVGIEGEGGFRKQLSLEMDGDAFVAQLDALGQTGEYALILNAMLPDGTILYEHRWVTLISAPWVKLIEPARGSSYMPGEPIPLRADVHLAGAASFEGLDLIVTLLRDGEPVQVVEMSRGDTSSETGENVVAYSGDFVDIEESGEYAIQAEMMAVLPGGRVFYHETIPVPLSVAVPPTSTPVPTFTPTPLPTLTPTPIPTLVPTLMPTAAPTPVSFLSSLVGSSFCLPGGLSLLALVLLLVLVVVLWRRRRVVPDKIKLLAELMRSRRESDEPPYVLILGSGPSVTLGGGSMRQIVKAVASSGDLDEFYEVLHGLSPLERSLILRKHFAQANISSGYRSLAKLVKEGFFDILFTTNLDPFLENALADSELEAADLKVLVCGEQSGAETMDILECAQPRVKVVKLHGDINSDSFAFTPSEISLISSKGERVLRHYLGYDLILIGHGPHDYDINRAIEREGGSIWYVAQGPPETDSPVYHAMRARGTQTNIISGKFGMFDRFFDALYNELMHSR
jgi:hypothetical protein